MEDNTAMKQLLTKEEEVENGKTIKDTAVEKAIGMMFEDTDIEMRTDLSPPMILAMSRGDVFVELFNSNVMKNFMKSIKVLSVSKARKGRGELVALVRNAQEIVEEPEISALARVLNKS